MLNRSVKSAATESLRTVTENEKEKKKAYKKRTSVCDKVNKGFNIYQLFIFYRHHMEQGLLQPLMLQELELYMVLSLLSVFLL